MILQKNFKSGRERSIIFYIVLKLKFCLRPVLRQTPRESVVGEHKRLHSDFDPLSFAASQLCFVLLNQGCMLHTSRRTLPSD